MKKTSVWGHIIAVDQYSGHLTVADCAGAASPPPPPLPDSRCSSKWNTVTVKALWWTVTSLTFLHLDSSVFFKWISGSCDLGVEPQGRKTINRALVQQIHGKVRGRCSCVLLTSAVLTIARVSERGSEDQCPLLAFFALHPKTLICAEHKHHQGLPWLSWLPPSPDLPDISDRI